MAPLFAVSPCGRGPFRGLSENFISCVFQMPPNPESVSLSWSEAPCSSSVSLCVHKLRLQETVTLIYIDSVSCDDRAGEVLHSCLKRGQMPDGQVRFDSQEDFSL